MKALSYEARMAEKARILREKGHARILAVESSCDETAIAIVDDGRIAERGTHEQLMRQDGVYRRFIEIREKAEGWRIAG